MTPKIILTDLKAISNTRESEIIGKESWGRVIENTGFNEEDIKNWHKQFERMVKEIEPPK